MSCGGHFSRERFTVRENQSVFGVPHENKELELSYTLYVWACLSSQQSLGGPISQ